MSGGYQNEHSSCKREPNANQPQLYNNRANARATKSISMSSVDLPIENLLPEARTRVDDVTNTSVKIVVIRCKSRLTKAITNEDTTGRFKISIFQSTSTNDIQNLSSSIQNKVL